MTGLTLGKMLMLYGGRKAMEQRAEYQRAAEPRLDVFAEERPSPVLGSPNFCRSAVAGADVDVETQASARKAVRVGEPASLSDIAVAVAAAWSVSCDELSKGTSGSKNTPRAVAAYLARSAGIPLIDVAGFFGFASPNAVSASSSKLAKRMASDVNLRSEVDELEQSWSRPDPKGGKLSRVGSCL